MTRAARVALLLSYAALATGAATACTGDPEPTPPDATGDPTPSVRTLSPMPAPDSGPPPGELVADLRQSSRDAALGRFQVWVGNGHERPVLPRRIVYRDWRFLGPITGERLREIPSGSERGFPLALPDRPRCDEQVDRPQVLTVLAGDLVAHVDVEDEADVVARHVTSRCFALDLERAVALAFDDEVTPAEGEDDVATLTLRLTPSGRAGHRVTVRSIAGTPVLTPPGQPVWRPRATVTSDGEPVVLELPVTPARCDAHAFAESGGATAFRVRLVLDGRPGEAVVRMGDEGAARVLDFAQEACGL